MADQEMRFHMNVKNKKPIYALISCMCVMLMLGIIYLWSIFREPVVQYFGWTQKGASSVFSIMLPMNVFGIIAGGFLNDKKGMRFVLRLGILFAVGGMLLTSFVTPAAPGLIYATYAGMVGFGAGLINNTCLSCVQKWWFDRKGLAVGLTNCAYALSSVVFAPLINWMLKSDLNVPGTFRVLAALLLFLFLAAGKNICQPPEGWIRPVEIKTAKTNVLGRQFKPDEVLRSPKYYLLVICIVCLTSGYLMLNPMFKSYAIAKGMTEAMAVSCVMISGIGSASGRLLVAWITDKLSSLKIMLAIYALLFFCMGLLFVSDGWGYAACIAGISFCYGASSSLTSIMNVESFGSKYLSSNYGLMTIAVLVSGIVSPSLGTALSPDGLPSTATLVVPMSMAIAGALCTIALAAVNRRNR
jgi:OFA family oxalate/formate antiporter-like MFS transporter